VRARTLLAGLLVASSGLVARAQTDSSKTRPTATPQAVRDLVRRAAEQRDAGDTSTAARRFWSADPVHRGPTRRRPPRDVDAARAETRADRATRRAYDGAPPVMLHTRNFVASKSCLDCHADGIWLGNRFGPPLSHPHLVSCRQCHVEATNREVVASGPVPGNVFERLDAPRPLSRPWVGAPPLMPHGTLMRTDCLSCHGPGGQPGLATDHPQRTNCIQCHAGAASLDQTSPFFR
jgi:cytochrome c-type protein NapB